MTGHELLGGRYELRGILGYGGMAEVRDGWDTRLHRAVAIKLLHPALNTKPDIRSRFVAEARAAAGLSHPNIVAVHDFGEHCGTPFIVMERLSGSTLEQEIERGPLPTARVQAVLDDVLAALAVAHSAGILHRDIKPGNILSSREAMKVADFGIAKTVGGDHTTGHLIGTMAYMSPARLAGASSSVVDDLYAVGVVGYEAATGQCPFPRSDLAALARAVMNGSAPPLAAVRPNLDASLAASIDRAMARDPRVRFTSADDMRSALSGHHSSPTAAALAAPPRRAATRVFTAPVPHAAPNTYFVAPPSRRHPMTKVRKILIAAAILFALAVAVLAFALEPSSQRAPAPAETTESAIPTTTAAPPPPPAPTSDQSPREHGPPGKGNGKHKKRD